MRIGTYAMLLCASLSLLVPVSAQQAPSGQHGIQIRTLAVALSNNTEVLHLRADDADLGEIFLETNRLGNHYRVPVRTFFFGINQEDGSFRNMGTVTLPETGEDFILVFVPTKSGYHVFPIRADDPDFRSDDSILFNFTPYPIGAILGGSKQRIEPMRHARVRPKIPEGANYYQATFAYESDGSMIPFNNTRWPVNPNLKGIVFVYINPQTQKPAYRGVSALAIEE